MDLSGGLIPSRNCFRNFFLFENSFLQIDLFINYVFRELKNYAMIYLNFNFNLYISQSIT